MKHPTDRELFSDVGPKGMLEWSEKYKTEKTAAAAYAEALQKWKEKQGGTITIRYRPVRSYDDPTKNDVSGQAVSGGTTSPLPSLLTMLGSAGGSSSGNRGHRPYWRLAIRLCPLG